jgi:hypothetical protein
LLTHLYLLIPVLDNQKHYWVGEDEVEKLLEKGADWREGHPLREQIARRYLKHKKVCFVISVPATKMYYEPTKPFPGASGEIAERPYNDVIEIDDVQGKRDCRVMMIKCLDLSRRWSVGATFFEVALRRGGRLSSISGSFIVRWR